MSLGSTVSLTDVATLPAYNIKPRDVVSEEVAPGQYREIGSVGFVEGTNITIVINDEVSHQYPFQNLRIEALGAASFNELRLGMIQTTSDLSQISAEEYAGLANTYATSGSAQGRFVSQTLALLDTISSLRNTYLKYDAHVVNTVNMLLEYLKQEKLTVMSDLLLGANFSRVPQLTPQEIASQGDVESMLDQAANLFGSNVASVETRAGFNVLTDYVQRGEDNNVEIKGPPRDDYLG